MQKVKEETTQVPSIYDQFIKILQSYQAKTVSIDYVTSSVGTLFAEYPLLLDNFKVFLPGHSSEDLLPRPHKQKKLSHPPETLILPELLEPSFSSELPFLRKLKMLFECNSRKTTCNFAEFSLAVELYIECVVTKQELFAMVAPLFVCSDLENLLKDPAAPREDAALEHCVAERLGGFFAGFKALAVGKEKARRGCGCFFRALPDFGATAKYGPSYSVAQRPRIKKRTELSFINRELISVPHGSEDFSFRHFRKNIYEDAMFKCEDEMFEVDMIILTTSHLIELLERAFDELEELSAEGRAAYSLSKDILAPLRLKCVERVFAEHSPEVLETLVKNPYRAVPVVLSRLQSKVDSWNRFRNRENEKGWKETMEKNYLRSLDHKAFYFKQTEKRIVNPKTFLIEIRTRFKQRKSLRQVAREFVQGQSVESYECFGGTKLSYYFNSFSSLTTKERMNRTAFVEGDGLIADFTLTDRPGAAPHYANEPDHAALPQFRLLFNSQQVLLDTVRVLKILIEKSGAPEKKMTSELFFSLFTGLLQLELPVDLEMGTFKYFIEGSPEEERNSANEEAPGFPVKHSPMNVRNSKLFHSFLPLQRGNQVYYSNTCVYYLFRYFYLVYERLLTARLVIYESAEEKYELFLETLYSALLQPANVPRLESEFSELLGKEAYIFFTFDKLALATLKSLQSVSSDPVAEKLHRLFTENRSADEEFYYSNCASVSQGSPIYRIHWDVQTYVLSITLVETPLLSGPELSVDNAKEQLEILNIPFETNLHYEYDLLYGRLNSFYSENRVGLADIESSGLLQRNQPLGLDRLSAKIQHPAGSEHFLISRSFCIMNVLLSDGTETCLCRNKGSFYQKAVEKSEEKFRARLNCLFLN